MPYDKAPDRIKNLPEHAQRVWLAAYNASAKEHKEESTRNAIAYAAVKKAGYEQDKDGKWHKVDKVIKSDEKSRYTLGIVYEPYAHDTDDEFTDPDELEKACWDFMRYLQAQQGVAKAGVAVIEQVQKALESDAEVRLEIDSEVMDGIAKRGVNGMHLEDLDGCEVVECYIAPADMVINDQVVKKGTWLAGIIWTEDHFKKIQSGEWTGYSMGGTAHKVNLNG